MLFKSLAVVGFATSSVLAQTRPSNISVCDWYTTALLKNNTAENQLKVLTLVVNTAVIGNYTPNTFNINVPGILANGTVNNTAVNLAPYFTGGFASTNTGETSGRSVNFLDGGGAAPLMQGMAANSTTSRQYILLTHLYSYFGTLLGCTQQGGASSPSAFPAYAGSSSQYSVHKFMALSSAEITYFIQQVALSALSLGVTVEDITPVGAALASLFGMRCAPEMEVIPGQGKQLQAICISADCPLAVGEAEMGVGCMAYEAVVEPAMANATNMVATGTMSAGTSGTATSAVATASKTGNAGMVNEVGVGMVAVVGGLVGALLL